MKIISNHTPVLTATLILASGLIHGQASSAFAIVSTTIDAGGGASRNERFAVSGTIGQPDAGALRGGNFEIQGGFWNRASVLQMPGAPVLAIQLNPDGSITLSWPLDADGYAVEATGELAPAVWMLEPGPIIDIADKHTLTVAQAGKRFFRLKKSVH